MITMIKKLTFEDDGIEIFKEASLQDTSFLAFAARVFGELSPAKNAVNKLSRGIRWGVLANSKITWLDRNSYRLDASLNKQEAGRTREFDLLPIEFVTHPIVQGVIMRAFERMRFDVSSETRAFEIQLSAIRYNVSNANSAEPSPPEPHQDSVDGSVIVINEHNVFRPENRIYDLDNQPLFAFTLKPSEGFLLKDDRYKHQVVPHVFQADRWPDEDKGFRDIIIIRFQPVGR